VYGGDGADYISGTIGSAGATIGITFAYSAFSDSTLSAMDTIAIGTGAATGTYVQSYAPGGLVLASFSATDVGTATNGVVVFTGTFNDDLTSRVAALNSAITTTGAVAFFNGSGNTRTYMFIQGGSTDTVVQVGLTSSAVAAGSVTLAGGRTVTYNMA